MLIVSFLSANFISDEYKKNGGKIIDSRTTDLY